jgi:hypothetical protein
MISSSGGLHQTIKPKVQRRGDQGFRDAVRAPGGVFNEFQYPTPPLHRSTGKDWNAADNVAGVLLGADCTCGQVQGRAHRHCPGERVVRVVWR